MGNISDYIISHKFIVGSQSESTAAVTSDYKNIPVFDNVVELMEIPLESGRKLEKVENITFENVSFQIEERSIFKNLNFSVQEGQNILIQEKTAVEKVLF